MRPDTRAGLLGTFAPVKHPAAFQAGGSLAALGTAAVDRVSHPCKVSVCPDRGVVAVNENDFVVFQLTVLSHPVGVENLHIRELPGCPFLSDPLDALAGSEPVLAHACGPASTDIPGCPAAAAADLDACNSDTLLGLVAEGTSPIDTGRALDPDNAALAAPCLHAVPEEFSNL